VLVVVVGLEVVTLVRLRHEHGKSKIWKFEQTLRDTLGLK
jgi:hypothetical protein